MHKSHSIISLFLPEFCEAGKVNLLLFLNILYWRHHDVEGFTDALKDFEEQNAHCVTGWYYLDLKESNILHVTQTACV